MIAGVEMAVADRPSFPEWFPLHLKGVLELVDHLHIRVGEPLADVVDLLPDEVTWEPQHPKVGRFFDEATERQAVLDWGISTGANWMFCFDSDEVLEEGAGEQIRAFIGADPHYRILMFPLTYSSHHREGHVLNRDETSVSSGRGFRLTPEMANFRYVGDEDGLHCGTLPGQERRRTVAILKEIVTVHYHACTPEEWMFKRNFYDGTTEVGKHGGIDHLYPLCGEYPFSCDRFGKEANAEPYENVIVDRDARFATLMRRLEGKPSKDALV